MKKVSIFVNGKRNGEYESYNEEGEIISKGKYEDGKK